MGKGLHNMRNGCLTVAEVASALGMRVRAVQGLIERGMLPAGRVGQQYLIARRELDKFIASRMERWGRVKMHQGPGTVPKKSPEEQRETWRLQKARYMAWKRKARCVR
jgi:excisionase family DNA binding protein